MAKWADKDDVKERLGDTPAKGYDDSDIQSKIDRAQEEIHSELQTVISDDTINAWTSSTVPETVKALVADLATAYMYAEVWHESFTDATSNAAGFMSKVDKKLKKVRKGEVKVVDKEGADVPRSSNRITSTTEQRNAIFTMTSPGDTNEGEGSLDDF